MLFRLSDGNVYAIENRSLQLDATVGDEIQKRIELGLPNRHTPVVCDVCGERIRKSVKPYFRWAIRREKSDDGAHERLLCVCPNCDYALVRARRLFKKGGNEQNAKV